MQTECCVKGEKCQSVICCESEIEKLQLNLEQKKNLSNIIMFSKLMSDNTRGNILYLLLIRGSLCVCDFANILEMSSQAISSQLVKLHDKGILKKEKIGLTVFYSIKNKEFQLFLEHIL